MTNERVQRRIDRLLDQIDEAEASADWAKVKSLAQDVLGVDPVNGEALAYLESAERRLTEQPGSVNAEPTPTLSTPQPTSFADGRYLVSKFLGEGGKKKVYLAHDETLDRDVAFALIKTEGLDDASRTRVSREAQAMARLGDHPNIVTVYDLGEEPLSSGGTQPYMVQPVLMGGDVEGLIEDAPDHKVPMEQALKIARETCLGLEFAHSKSIIHRDLKPGNVWLSEDGTAKIGDFGLAIATDRSRLTQEGMMVGTASYMPPEQALGGEVTAQSDLYSLGAMLYELVTGRPPFIGDESVAIITQHLNTPPVSPTWHNPEISPGLETLIMRLLEKDASKRPASAAEVSQALNAIGAGVVAVAADAETPTGPDPVYRRTFVGRETELKKLEGIFDGAISGNGALVMVVGEPGIGKTSITEQLATYVAMRGGKTLVGHCYEEGSLSLPYLAFVESLRSYVLSREPEDLKSELGTGAGEVARIVSEIRDRIQVELPPAGDPDEDRYRLLQAVTGFLRSASSVSPLMVVLEDLHDADRGTLDMLTHVARNLSGSRLLIIGTYRDVEVDRAHPLSATLAELRRIDSFDRVPLRGLTPDEVQRMVNSVFGHERAPRELAETIHRQTEGNPLFVQEVLRYFVEEGLMERDGSQLRRVGEEGLADKVPEGLRDVIGKRLTRLTPQTNEILSIAAVVGREFRLDVLQRVSAVAEDQLYAALEESSAGSVIEERASAGAGVTFRFTHAFFRQTLYEEIFTPRRLQYHRQIGVALEQVHAGRLDDHATELAEHFAQSTEKSDLEKAQTYSEMAASRAMAVYAYSEAAGLLERALQVQQVLDPDDVGRRCDLLLSWGEALMVAGNPIRVYEEIAEEAFVSAESLKDRERAAAASRLGLEAMRRFGGASIVQGPGFALWLERSDQYAEPETTERVSVDLGRAMILYGNGSSNEASQMAADALALARRLGNPQEIHMGIAVYLICSIPRTSQRDFEFEYRLAQECIDSNKQGVTGETLATVLGISGLILLQHGDRPTLEKLSVEIDKLAERMADPRLVLGQFAQNAHEAAFDGRLDECMAELEEMLRVAEQIGSQPLGFQQYNLVGTPVLLNLGRLEYAAEKLAEALRSTGAESPGLERRPVVQGLQAALLADSGQLAQAKEIIEYFMERWDLNTGPESASVIGAGWFLRAAILLEDTEMVRLLRPCIEELSPFYVVSSSNYTCPARLLGTAAAILGEHTEALAYFRSALNKCEQIRHRPELALTRLDLAELLLEHYRDERAEALEHLNFAITEFQEMKMQPSLERALRHRDILKA